MGRIAGDERYPIRAGAVRVAFPIKLAFAISARCVPLLLQLFVPPDILANALSGSAAG